jgi:hypothetical protein
MMDRGRPFCTAPRTWQDGLTRYPTSQSDRWNTVSLKPEDYDAEFYNVISDLEKRHQKSEFTEADFAHLDLTFCLLTAQGEQYNLIPNGNEIRVTKSNAYEYFQRVHSAYESMRQSLALNSPPPPPPPPAAVLPSSRIRATTTGLCLTAQDIPSLDWLCWSARNDPERLILPPGKKLRWAVMPQSNDFMIRLRPDGEYCVVEPDDLALFLSELQMTMQAIRHAIETFGYYPPKCLCAAPAKLPDTTSKAATPVTTAIQPSVPWPHTASMLPPPRGLSSNGRSALYASARAAAAAAAAAATGQDRRYIPSVSPEELEKQRALFSPTHETGGILSPFQEINL